MPEKLSLIAREPIRVYIYTVSVAILAALVGFGVIDANTQQIVETAVAALLVVGGVEGARSHTRPAELSTPIVTGDADAVAAAPAPAVVPSNVAPVEAPDTPATPEAPATPPAP